MQLDKLRDVDAIKLDSLVQQLCNAAGYDKSYVYYGANIHAIHQRYFIYRFIREEINPNRMKDTWMGVRFEKQLKSLRKRIAPLLEKKYQTKKALFHETIKKAASNT